MIKQDVNTLDLIITGEFEKIHRTYKELLEEQNRDGLETLYKSLRDISYQFPSLPEEREGLLNN